MLTALKEILKQAFLPILYFTGFGTAALSIFKEARWGLFLLIFLIPQPNIWYKLHSYLLGKDFLDVLFFATFLGIIFQKKEFSKTNNTFFIIIFISFSYFALWNSSFRFNLPLPITPTSSLLMSWKNYAQMIAIYFLVLAIIKDEKQQKELVLLLAIVVFIIVVRSFRGFSGGESFSYGKRYGGAFEVVGLGANHLGSFIAYTWSFFLGLVIFKPERKLKLLFWAICVIGLHPLFFAYSRGAYLAVCVVIMIYCFLQKRSWLVPIMICLLFWQVILPASVVDRITMTKTETGELEESADLRLGLWNTAVDMFIQNPIVGTGYDGFRLTLAGNRLTDTHNFYLKTLCEQGVIGIFILLLLLLRAFMSGYKLYKHGKTPFQKGLGLGFMGAVFSMTSTNMFGDRFSYYSVGSYFWIFWALVDRGILLNQEESDH